MKFFRSLFLLAPILPALFIGFPPPAAAEADYCFCQPKNLANVVQEGLVKEFPAQCLTNVSEQQCKTGEASKDKSVYTCEPRETEANCQASLDAWQTRVGGYQRRYTVLGIVIPSCLFEPVLPPECRDISLFVELLINFGSVMFTIVGAWALVFFIYGGFNLIIAQGNPEKIKKGGDAMLAAVIGLVIVFAGYLLIRFLGEAVGVKEFYQLPR